MTDQSFVLRLMRAATLAAVALWAPPASADGHLDLELSLVKVGETEIKLGHVLAMVSVLPEPQRSLPPEQVFYGSLNRLIQQEAVAQSMTEIPVMLEMQLENERRSLLTSRAVEAMRDEVSVSDAAIEAEYRDRFESAASKREFRAAHILVKTQEKAQMLANELAAGGDFDALARTHSIGPTGPNGGNLGWFGPGRMVAPFEDAVRALQVGQVSPPVETQFGWHVILLNETRIPNLPSLAEVRAELEQHLWQLAYDARLEALIDAVPVVQMDLSSIDPAMILKPEMMMKPEEATQ